MSAPSPSRRGELHTNDVAPPLSDIPTPVSGASESTLLVPLGCTLSDLIDIRIQIEITLGNAPNKQEFTAAVRGCLTECQELLANVTQVTATTKAHAEALHGLLQAVHTHLQDRKVHGKRAKFMGIARALSPRPASPSPMYHVQIQDAFDALKNSLLHPVMAAPQTNNLTVQETLAVIDVNPQSNTGQSSMAPEVSRRPAGIGASPAFLAPVTPSLQNSISTSIIMALPTNPTHSHSTPAAAEANRPDIMTESAATRPTAPEQALPTNEGLLKRPAEEIGSKRGATTAPAKKNPLWGTVVDTVDEGLRLLSSLTEFIPGPAGPIVKLMAGTGLTIIETLQGMADNREEAANLGRYVGALIQTVGRFLEPPDDGTTENCDAETAKQLQAFLDVLDELKKNLVELEGQGRFKQGVSHKTNSDDLKKWETTISRAFATLQAQLSLGSISLLTKMNTANALQERDRLVSLLGDGDIGATEKASDAADLMCLPGTRTEVLDQVDQWISDPSGSRIFWISGVAGCGKSALAATIAGRPRAIPTSVAVFYFVLGNQGRNKRVLCSLSRQLARFGHGCLEQFILSGVKARPDIATSHLETQFQHLIVDPLKKLVAGSPPVILVIDALDEWNGNNNRDVVKLLELINRAHKELPPSIRFVLASRNEPHLVRSLESDPMKPLVTRCPLDAVLKSEAGRDIKNYIKGRFVKLNADFPIAVNGEPWPKVGDVDNLVMLSDGLFQWAATVMSYIEARRSQGRLQEIIQSPERYRGLDNLYRGVLERSSGEEMDEQVSRLLQDVLGAILTAPIPVNATTISYLCSKGVDKLRWTMELIQEEVLPILASMFIIPKEPTLPITVSHKSVLDYLTNKDRCTDSRFYTDVVVQNDRMLLACFRLMESNLKRDVCGIDDPSKLNQEVQDQVERHLPYWLRYSCQHWVAHAKGSCQSTSPESRRRLGDFSRKHLLHWLEVMSLIGLTKEVIPMARDVELWLSAFSSLSPVEELTQRLWSDTQRFVTMFTEPISRAAAHIYISALCLAPTETELVRQLAGAEAGVRVIGGLVGEQWPPPPAETPEGHTGAVSSASSSPDGRTILFELGDKTLRLWDTESGAQKGRTLKGHTRAVTCASFSPDIMTILTGSSDNTLRLWDAKSGAQLGRTLNGHTRAVTCVSFSPDGKTMLSGSSDSTLRRWDAKSATQKGRTLKGHTGAVTCASFSPDGTTIVSGSVDKTLRLWDAGSGAQKGRTLNGHTRAVTNASFSPDGTTILSWSADKTLRLWDAGSGAQKGRTLNGHTRAVTNASFSPDGTTILSWSVDETLRLWDAGSGDDKSGALTGHKGAVTCASFSPDGRTILSSSADGTLRCWNTKLRMLKSLNDTAAPASLSPGARTALFKTTRQRRLPSNTDPSPLEPRPVGYHLTTMPPSLWPVERTALSGWDISSSAWLHPRRKMSRLIQPDQSESNRPPPGQGGVLDGVWTHASFSPDGRTILSWLENGTLQTRDADSGALKAEPQNGHTRGVSCFMFSPDGGTIVSGSYDKTVRLWDTETGALKGRPLSTESVVSELSFSVDGFTLTGKMYDGRSQEWDLVMGVPSEPKPVHKGSVSREGWIFHRDIHWFWVPFSSVDWLLCGSRLALHHERVVYIFDVSGIKYIVE